MSRIGNSHSLSRLLSVALLVGFFLAAGTAAANAQQPSDFRTPPAGPAPRINGPKVYGARPGHPFLYRIPATGKRPMRFSVRNLPSTLRLDAASGIISGTTPAAGKYRLTVTASNAVGKVERTFTIMAGDTIGLTPQMGWNDWYTFYDHITETDVRSSAKAMIASGMADYGYQFVDIDDAWARKPGSSNPHIGGNTRDAQGNILPNDRFPDMRALTAYIHSLGLKAGIYTSPGPLTCAHFEGSYQHEKRDAQQFARWGFDLLKYDWCSYTRVAKGLTPGEITQLVAASGKPDNHGVVKDSTLAELELPYKKMGSILKGLDRDVVLNMCQYGMGDVWKWGKEVGGNSWRTTTDLPFLSGASLPAFYSVGFANARHSDFAAPGGWNDPDYLLLGTVGDAKNANAPPRKTALTPGEQYSYMSMWSLMASPLIFSGDMTKLDAFTLNVLCNSEVIDIDQDSLGRQASIVRKTPEEFVLVKKLDDGSLAVGLFNLTETPRTISISWHDLGIHGPQRVRDVWRQRNTGIAQNTYSATVNTHDVMLVRFIPKSADRH